MLAVTGRSRMGAIRGAEAPMAPHCTPSQGTHIYPSDMIVQDSTLQWRDRSGLDYAAPDSLLSPMDTYSQIY